MKIESVVQNVGAFTSEAILIADVDLTDGAVMTLRWCNPAFERMTGYSFDETVGQPARFLVGKDTDRARHLEIIDQLMNWESFINEMQTNRKDGTPYWVEMSWEPLRDETGTFRFWICVLRDVTAQKQAACELEEAKGRAEQAQDRLVQAIEALDDAFVIYDGDDRLVMCNEKYLQQNEVSREMIRPGVRYEDLIRNNLQEGLYPTATGDKEAWIAGRMENFRNPGADHIAEIGHGRFYKMIERRTSRDDLVSLRIEVTETLRQKEALERYAFDLDRARARNEYASLHDDLTELANRRYLNQELSVRVGGGKARHKPFGVLHIDLDRFKEINDAFGHDAGDMILKVAAQNLRGCLARDDFVARVGGDEFVILTEETDSDQLAALASRIIERMREPVSYKGQECWFGASAGVAIADNEHDDPRQYLINADIALYQAKQAGRNRWTLFTAELQEEIVRRKRTADDIRRALESGEFLAFYQPQFDAGTLQLTGVEALVRWDHPERGILTPYFFMDVAERANLVHALDEAVLERVAQDCDAWDRAGIEVPKVSVNVSGERLKQTDFVGDIARAGIDSRRLTIELLESIFLDDKDDLLAFNLDQLKEMGCGIELDDFGTGHSSLISLIRLQPTRIKIDQQFIFPILESADARALVGSIIEIGHSLNVGVVAEGVETHEHGMWLNSRGCDVLQGFGYGRPMSSPALIEFVRNQTWREGLPPMPPQSLRVAGE